MKDPILSEFSGEFSQALFDICEAPTPAPDFVAGLERRLLERHAPAVQTRRFGGRRQGLGKPFLARPRVRWQVAPLVLLALLVLALAAIGPQRALAQVQRWLGYVPGVGFVNLAETQVLALPVEVTRQGVTLRVDQLVAGPERTEVLISNPGLSEASLPWPNEALDPPNFRATLALPDGSRLEATRWELRIGAAKIEFPALPESALSVTLLVPRLPLVPAGALPEDWTLSLPLRPASGDLEPGLFPQPYSPAAASAARHGITLRVLDVAQTPAETAVRYQIEWSDPGWVFRFLGSSATPELRDDLGHIYPESPSASGSSVTVLVAPQGAAPTPAATSHTGTLVFPALSQFAGRAGLWVDALEFYVPTRDSLRLDWGDRSQPGETWTVDLPVEVAGFPMHIGEARWSEVQVETAAGSSQLRPVLEFDLDLPEEVGGTSLFSFEMSNPGLGVYGWAHRTLSNGMEQFKGRLEFTTGEIPAGGIELQTGEAGLRVSGPWEAAWNIPGRESGNAAPARIVPQTVPRTESEVRPVVEQAFLSDVLTALEFGAEGLPEGVSFLQVLPYDPVTFDPQRRSVEMYLEDQWGRRYEPGRNQVFIRPDGEEAGYDPRWRFYPALEPLAQSVRARIPGMELFKPGQASFTMDVPEGMPLHAETYAVTVMGGGGPERQETQVRYVSDPWAVDISFELAGYRLHFTQAQIEHYELSQPSHRLILSGASPERRQGSFYLAGMRFAEIERPDGDIMRMDAEQYRRGLVSSPFGGIGPLEQGSRQFQATIVLDVTGRDGAELLPGRYRVELSGVTLWAPGPWEMEWPLLARP